jgi:hypothetical protein
MMGTCVSLWLQVEVISQSKMSASQLIVRILSEDHDVKKKYSILEHVPVFLKKYNSKG